MTEIGLNSRKKRVRFLMMGTSGGGGGCENQEIGFGHIQFGMPSG